MIKKALATLLLTASSVLSEGFTKDLVIESWNGKTPDFIMKQFGMPLNFKELDKLGLERWTHERDLKGREDLLTYKIVLIDNGWKHEGRKVFSFQADFYKAIGGNGPYKCWDAFYVLSPKE
jgi:hypothetical protein|tara:strand:- start:2750 stop:3112 length:363 start_codon:yes stop_codon:yes gene_type:complete